MTVHNISNHGNNNFNNVNRFSTAAIQTCSATLNSWAPSSFLVDPSTRTWTKATSLAGFLIITLVKELGYTSGSQTGGRDPFKGHKILF